MRRLLNRPSPGTVLGGLALFIALGGTALAATGQLVNLADGDNAANLAKVDSTGSVNTKQFNIPTPNKNYTLHATVLPFKSYTDGLTGPTSAIVAVDRIVVNDYYAAPETKLIRIYSYTEAAGAPCNYGDGGANLRPVSSYTLPAGETIVDTPTTPWMFKAVGGRPWCLMATYFTPDGTSSGSPEIQMSGHVVSGTPPSGTQFRSSRRGKSDPTLPGG